MSLQWLSFSVYGMKLSHSRARRYAAIFRFRRLLDYTAVPTRVAHEQDQVAILF